MGRLFHPLAEQTFMHRSAGSQDSAPGSSQCIPRRHYNAGRKSERHQTPATRETTRTTWNPTLLFSKRDTKPFENGRVAHELYHSKPHHTPLAGCCRLRASAVPEATEGGTTLSSLFGISKRNIMSITAWA